MTTINLATLPPPNVVETLSYETIVREMRAAAGVVDPSAFADLRESDPAMKLIEVFAYRELLLRARVNDAASQSLVATATGTGLDNLGAWLGVTRKVLDPGDPANGIPPTYESDDDFRDRIVNAPQAWSVAGPRSAYEALALEADELVADAYATSPNPGEVSVFVMEADAAVAQQSTIDAVLAYLSAESRRPLTDLVTVSSGTPRVVLVNIEVAIDNDVAAQATIDAMLARWEEWIESKQRINAILARAQASAVLWSPTVTSVTYSAGFMSNETLPTVPADGDVPIVNGAIYVSVGGDPAYQVWSEP
jgi:phage-related baseplate assembly protein